MVMSPILSCFIGVTPVFARQPNGRGSAVQGGGRRRPMRSVPLEILHVSLVLFRRRARVESAEIAALAGLGIDLAGIEPVLARLQFADHDRYLLTQSQRR